MVAIPTPPAGPVDGASRDTGPPYAALALSLCSQQWPDLGLDLDLLNNTSTPPAGVVSSEVRREIGKTPPCSDTDDIYPIVDRIVALLLLRIVALVSSRTAAENREQDDEGGESAHHTASSSSAKKDGGTISDTDIPNTSAEKKTSRIRTYSDFSTSTIARTELESRGTCWPDPITPQVISQLRDYVHRICADYRAVHYHNVEHCYHVTLSANKLLDMMLNERVESTSDEGSGGDGGQQQQQTAAAATATVAATHLTPSKPKRKRKRPMFGLRTDTLTHLAFIFSALIHDADHTGITNRQLVDEADELALLYNDQSVAEQRSLAIAFSTLLLPDFEQLREVMFPTRDEYKRFRKVVINLVLTTDIASPERTQIVKSKWKEAFPSAAQVAREKRRSSTATGAASAPSSGRRLVRTRGKSRSPTDQLVGRGHQQLSPPEAVQPVEPPPIPATLRQKATDEKVKHRDGVKEDFTTTCTLNDVEEDKVYEAKEDTTIESRRKASDASHVSIVEPLPSDIHDHPFEASFCSLPHYQTETASLSETKTEKDTLKSSFFRGRVSMGLGYMKGETDSVSTTYFEYEKAKNSRMSSKLQAGAHTSIHQKTSPEEQGDNASSSFHDGEEEDEIESDDRSVSSSSVESERVQEDDVDSQDDVIMTGVTLSKLDVNGQQDTVNKMLPSTVSPTFAHSRVQPAPARGCMRVASDRKLVTSHLQKTKVNTRERKREGQVGDFRSPVFRRYSLPNLSKAPKYELRLGIRRAVDLTGQPIETYAPRGSLRSQPSGNDLDSLTDDIDFDEPDELKASAVLEHLVKAADVAAVLQGWDNLIKWSSRLFREQKASAIVGRGDDPEASWYEGQIVFMDIYIMPLAQRLAEPGIFDDETGEMFAQCVQDNRARWLIEGRRKTEMQIQEWEEKYC